MKGKGKIMRTIHLSIQIPDKFSEFSGDDVEHVALMVESIVSEALLEVADTVSVEDVTVEHFPEYTEANEEQSSIRYENA